MLDVTRISSQPYLWIAAHLERFRREKVLPVMKSFIIASSAVFLISAPALARAAEAKQAAAGTQWVTLGTLAGPLPMKDRAQIANALIVNGVPYLVDAGNGVATQMTKAGISITSVGTIFISHNHNDHNADMGTVMGISWTAGRSAPIHLYGPAGTKFAMDGFLQFYSANSEIRSSEQNMLKPPNDVFVVHDIPGPGLIYQDSNLKVFVVENTHFHFRQGSPAEGKDKSYAFRFETPDKVIVYTGDTGPSDAVTELAKGADILVSEVMNLPLLEQTLAKSPYWSATPELTRKSLLRHFKEDHISAEDVGRMAAKAGVKEVVLTHVLPAVPESQAQQAFIDGVKKYYPGPVVVANDLMRF